MKSMRALAPSLAREITALDLSLQRFFTEPPAGVSLFTLDTLQLVVWCLGSLRVAFMCR